jgi:hypothetical protein
MVLTRKQWISIQQYDYEYIGWKDFLLYRPFELPQWKAKVLLWWNVCDDQLQLLYISPEKGLSVDSWTTVRIGVKGVGGEEVRAWIEGHYTYVEGRASQQ